MAKIFSTDWMQNFAEAWNADSAMIDNLAAAGFTSTIGFGCSEDEQAVGVIKVENGRVTYAGDYQGQHLDWDMRADVEAWQEWISDGFGFEKLGVAVSSGKLKFLVGDYRKMIRNPNMAKPFLRHFELMQGLDTQFIR